MAWNGPSWIWTHRRAHTNCLVAYRPSSNFLYFVFLVWIIFVFVFIIFVFVLPCGMPSNQWRKHYNWWQVQTLALSINPIWRMYSWTTYWRLLGLEYFLLFHLYTHNVAACKIEQVECLSNTFCCFCSDSQPSNHVWKDLKTLQIPQVSALA